MKLVILNFIPFSLSVLKKKTFKEKNIQLILLNLFLILLPSCAAKVSFKVERPPVRSIENIKFIEVRNFQIVSGKISLPYEGNDESRKISNEFEKSLKPTISNFNSRNEQNSITSDLLRAALLHELSLHSPYQLINTTGNEESFRGVVPDESQVAILSGKVKYEEIIFESQEELSYFTNVKNKGATLEQSLLTSVVTMGAESKGAGFLIETPYIEQISAMEVEFSLVKKSNNRKVIPSQSFQTFYMRKWGGSTKTSHLTPMLRNIIKENFHNNDDTSESIISKIDRAGMALTSPTEYFARGFNLKKDKLVPQTSLDIKSNLARKVARKYVKQISPYHEFAELIILDGNKIAVNLIKGNAYEEAISFLLNLNNREAEDEYNLGLAYEANGKTTLARKHYKVALDLDRDNLLFGEALRRTDN